MKQKSKVVRVLSRLFLAFLASVFFFAFLVLLSLQMTLFSQKYVVKQAEKASYYWQVTKEVNKQIENAALGSNIPEGVLKNVVSEKYVKEDMKHYFSAIYQPKMVYEIRNKEAVKKSALQHINDYAAANYIEQTDETKQAVALIADQSATIYQNYIELPFLLAFGKRVVAYQKPLIFFMILCALLWGVFSAVLFSALRGYVHRLFRYWEYIFVGSGLMMIVLPVIVLQQRILKRIGIQSKAMYDFAQAYLSSFLKMFIVIGIVVVLLGIFSAIFSEIKRKRLFSPK